MSNFLVNIWSSPGKKVKHPQFSGVVRNVGEKKWLQGKKVATRRGGWKRGISQDMLYKPSLILVQI